MTSPHPAAIQEPTQSCLIRTKDALVTQEITRVSGALCQELGSKTKYQNMLLVFLSLRKLQGCQELCVRDGGRGRKRDQACIPYYISQYHIVFSVFWFSPTSFAGGTAAWVNREQGDGYFLILWRLVRFEVFCLN